MLYKDVTLAHTDQAAYLLSQGICLVTGVPEYQEKLRNRFDMGKWESCFYGTAFAIANEGLQNPYQDCSHWLEDTDKAVAVKRIFYWSRATDEQVVRIYRSIDENGWIQQAGENWDRENMNNLHFKQANFAGATFRHAYFANVNFESCDLSGADFTGSSLSTTQFEESSLANATFGNISIDSCRFFGCDLSGSDFSQVRNAQNAYWYHSTYDEHTKFPLFVDPEQFDMTRV